jgi:hypothetical protein
MSGLGGKAAIFGQLYLPLGSSETTCAAGNLRRKVISPSVLKPTMRGGDLGNYEI